MLAKVMAIGGMVGILLMAGRRAKNPVKRLLLGAYSLYDTTSWLSICYHTQDFWLWDLRQV